MSDIKTGGPAFPQLELDNHTGNISVQHFGMTLRDYFAAKAMVAFITEQPWGDGSMSSSWIINDKKEHGNLATNFAIAAYRMADAMLKARGEV